MVPIEDFIRVVAHRSWLQSAVRWVIVNDESGMCKISVDLKVPPAIGTTDASICLKGYSLCD